MLLIIAGCGDDDDEGDATADTASAAPTGSAPRETTTDGGDTETTAGAVTAAESGETFTIRYPHVWTPGGAEDSVCAQGFADAVEERSNGRLEFEMTAGGALGGEIELEENVFQGVFEMTGLTNVGWGTHQPRASVMGLPFLFEDTDDVLAYLESDLHQELADELLTERGARILAPCMGAFREIVATRPLLEPADFEGLKIRVPELPTWVQTMEALGAAPTPIPFPEAYEAMSTGLVDAVDITFTAGIDLGFDELGSEFSSTRHLWSGAWIIINEEFFQGLPEDLQQVLTDVAEETYAKYEATSDAYLTDGYARVEEAGANAHIDNVDRQALEDATAATRQSLAEQFDIVDEYQRILEVVGE